MYIQAILYLHLLNFLKTTEQGFQTSTLLKSPPPQFTTFPSHHHFPPKLKPSNRNFILPICTFPYTHPLYLLNNVLSTHCVLGIHQWAIQRKIFTSPSPAYILVGKDMNKINKCYGNLASSKYGEEWKVISRT